jgi:hypothetical protein
VMVCSQRAQGAVARASPVTLLSLSTSGKSEYNYAVGSGRMRGLNGVGAGIALTVGLPSWKRKWSDLRSSFRTPG